MIDSNDLRQRLALRFGLPPEKPFVTLSHAVSWIALRRSVGGSTLSKLLGIGKPTCQNRDSLNKTLDGAIKFAVEDLTEAGVCGKMQLLGKLYGDILSDDNDHKLPTEAIPALHLADYRGFDTLDDTLFPDPYRKVQLAWDAGRSDVFSPLGRHYRFVLVNRADLMREFPATTAECIEEAPFEVREIDDWIRSTSLTGMKAARDAFMKTSRAKGLSAAFEMRWRAIRPRERGRPRKVS